MFETSRIERSGFAVHRSVVMAREGMVATSQPLATEVGVSILKKGGNALDAAIATALTLSVVEPMSTASVAMPSCSIIVRPITRSMGSMGVAAALVASRWKPCDSGASRTCPNAAWGQ